MTGLIAHFGALGVLLLMVPEAACVPIPSELTLLFAGFAVHQGWMSLPLAVLAATAGNLLGSLLAYGVGAAGLPQRIRILRPVLDRWDGLLERHGIRAVFIARLLPLARTFVSLPAGVRMVPLLPFVWLTALGSAIWALVFVVAGVLAGNAWSTVDSLGGRLLLVGGLVVLAASLVRRQPKR